MQHSTGGLLHGHSRFTNTEGVREAFPVNFANWLGRPIGNAVGIANRRGHIYAITGADTAISTTFSYKNKWLDQVSYVHEIATQANARPISLETFYSEGSAYCGTYGDDPQQYIDRPQDFVARYLGDDFPRAMLE